MFGSNEDPGLVPRAVGALFAQMSEIALRDGISFSVTLSALEILEATLHPLVHATPSYAFYTLMVTPRIHATPLTCCTPLLAAPP